MAAAASSPAMAPSGHGQLLQQPAAAFLPQFFACYQQKLGHPSQLFSGFSAACNGHVCDHISGAGIVQWQAGVVKNKLDQILIQRVRSSQSCIKFKVHSVTTTIRDGKPGNALKGFVTKSYQLEVSCQAPLRSQQTGLETSCHQFSRQPQ
jgi:hypothetical protein